MTTDERLDPPRAGDERSLLTAFLDYHRTTLAMKCDGLSDEQLRRQAVPPSELSLLGLVRHLADVERHWFRRVLVGEQAPPLFYSDEDPDGEFHLTGQHTGPAAFEAWQAEIDHARRNCADLDLGTESVKAAKDGTRYSLRWVLLHMIEEYARHNGHADLLRERVDGATGE